MPSPDEIKRRGAAHRAAQAAQGARDEHAETQRGLEAERERLELLQKHFAKPEFGPRDPGSVESQDRGFTEFGPLAGALRTARRALRLPTTRPTIGPLPQITGMMAVLPEAFRVLGSELSRAAALSRPEFEAFVGPARNIGEFGSQEVATRIPGEPRDLRRALQTAGIDSVAARRLAAEHAQGVPLVQGTIQGISDVLFDWTNFVPGLGLVPAGALIGATTKGVIKTAGMAVLKSQRTVVAKRLTKIHDEIARLDARAAAHQLPERLWSPIDEQKLDFLKADAKDLAENVDFFKTRGLADPETLAQVVDEAAAAQAAVIEAEGRKASALASGPDATATLRETVIIAERELAGLDDLIARAERVAAEQAGTPLAAGAVAFDPSSLPNAPVRGMKDPKTLEAAKKQLKEVEDHTKELEGKLDEMDNPDTQAGQKLQDRIDIADEYQEALERAIDDVEDVAALATPVRKAPIGRSLEELGEESARRRGRAPAALPAKAAGVEPTKPAEGVIIIDDQITPYRGLGDLRRIVANSANPAAVRAEARALLKEAADKIVPETAAPSPAAAAPTPAPKPRKAKVPKPPHAKTAAALTNAAPAIQDAAHIGNQVQVGHDLVAEVRSAAMETPTLKLMDLQRQVDVARRHMHRMAAQDSPTAAAAEKAFKSVERQLRRARADLVTKGARRAGKTPPPIAPPPDDILAPPPGAAPDNWANFETRAGSIKRQLAEFLTDKYDGANAQSARANDVYLKAYGVGLPPERMGEIMLALLGGTSQAAIAHVNIVWGHIKKWLGSDIPQAELNRYLMAMRAKEIFIMLGAKRVAVGKVTSVAHADQVLRGVRDRLGAERWGRLRQAALVVTGTYQDLMRNAVEAGMVHPELAAALYARYPNYVPIHLLDQFWSKTLIDPFKAEVPLTIKASSDLKRLGEWGQKADLRDPLETLGGDIVRAYQHADRNRVFRAVADNFQLKDVQDFPPGTPTATYAWMEEGKRFVRKAPTWLVDEMKRVDMINGGEMSTVLRGMNAIPRAGFTGLSIPFFFRNLAFDTLTVMLTHGVMPWDVARNLVRTLRGMAVTDELMLRKTLARGDVSGLWGRTPADIQRAVDKSGNISVIAGPTTTAEKVRHLADPRNILETISRLGHAIEEAPRLAVFEKRLLKGDVVEEAAFASRRASIDFQRSGYAVAAANSAILYFNAAVQGFALPFRAGGLIGRDVTINQGLFQLRVASFSAFNIALYGWNRQFPEYDDVPAWIKYQSLIIMLPSERYSTRGNKLPNFISVVPQQREWSMFSGPFTYIMRQMDSEHPEDFGRFFSNWYESFTPLGRITGGSGLPVPQPLAIGAELASNYDHFRGRPITPEELRHLPLNQQVLPNTSSTAKVLGSLIHKPPTEVDFVIDNFFGSTGRQIREVLDDVVLRNVAKFAASNAPMLPEPLTSDGIRRALAQPRPEVTELVKQYDAIKPPEVEPADLGRRRAEFRSGVAEEYREEFDLAVARTERTFDVPAVGQVPRTFYNPRGGELQRTLTSEAARDLNIDAESTRQVAKKLAGFRDNPGVRALLAEADAHITNDPGYPGRLYRDVYGQVAIGSRIYLLGVLGAQFPDAAQVQDDPTVLMKFRQQVNDGLAQLNPAERADDLLAVWQSFTVRETPTPGVVDYRELRHREEWRRELPPEDRELLDNELTARLSPVRKQYWEDSRYMARYWELADHMLVDDIDLLDLYYRYIYRDSTAQAQWRALNPNLADFIKELSQERRIMRAEDPELDRMLVFWYDYIKLNLQSGGISIPKPRGGGPRPAPRRRRSTQAAGEIRRSDFSGGFR